MIKSQLVLGVYGLLCWLLVGCLATENEPNPAVTRQVEGIVANVPSISELSGTPTVEIPPLPTLDTEAVARGQRVYAEHCSECHGARLEGEAEWQIQDEDGAFRAPPHDADGHTWHHSDRILLEAILLGGRRLPEGIGGSSDMPAFGEILTADEMAAVLSFIKSSWPDDIRAIQWQQTVQDRQK
jgi:mono/diheme cytochrome c family protein